MTTFLCFIFFLSGISALTFEILWFHLAGLALGNSVWTVSIVLSGFMVGLAFGNGIAALKGGRIASCLRLYVFLEVIIAISGFCAVLIFPHLSKILVPIFSLFLGQPLALNFIRMAVILAIMLIPTIAMGATLPVIVKELYRAKNNFGHVLGMLYGWNTVGAVVGVLLTEFFCIEKFGIQGTGIFAAVCNMGSAAGALLLARRTGSLTKVFVKKGETSILSRFSMKAGPLLAGSFLNGFVFLALEVIWFRFLILFFNGVSVNFAIMLAVVLTGLGCGGLIASKFFSIRPQAHIHLMPFVCVNGILITILYANFPHLLRIIAIYGLTDAVGILLSSFFLIFPIACFSGIIFTMLGKSLHTAMDDEIAAAGFFTMANTLGSMCGALIAGLTLIPLLGVEKSFFLLSCLYGVVILLTVHWEAVFRAKRTVIAHSMMIGLFLASLAIYPFGLMQGVLLRISVAPFISEGMKRAGFKEGVNETIQYLQKDLLGKPYYHYLMANSYSMASTAAIARRYMNFFVYWPQAAHPHIKRALLIAYGCGTTAKALTDTKSIEHIDIVDTSKDIVRMSALVFPDPADNPLHDPRVAAYIEDGRFFLLTTPKAYDLITGEPPPVKIKGIVNLYTQEYFQLMADRLSEGGMVTYWLSVSSISVKEAKSIIKAFCNVFDNCSLWAATPLSWMLAGVKNFRQAADYGHFISQWDDPAVGPKMRDLGFENAGQFGSLFIADSRRLAYWVKDSLPLTDNYPKRISDKLLDQDFLDPELEKFMDPQDSRKNFRESVQIAALWPQALRREAIKQFAARGIIFRIISGDEGMTLIDKLYLCVNDPLLRPYLVWALNSDNGAQNIITAVLRDKKPVTLEEGKEHLAARSVLEGNYDLAERYYARLNNVPSNPKDEYFALRMYLLFLAQEKERARAVGEQYINLYDSGQAERKAKVELFWKWLNE